MEDLGLYIHIPYCKRKCTYCNFHFSTQLDTKERLIQSILSEIKQRASEISNNLVQTIYFGGGTPSILSINEITSILDQVHKYYNIDHKIEISLEANPDDLTQSYLHELSSNKFNRLSIGIQSFQEDELIWMNRAHNVKQSHDAIFYSRDAGFENISCDLIFGIPGSNHNNWKHNLETIIQYNIPHISCYALTVEEKTKLHYDIQSKKIPELNDQYTIEQMQILFDYMEKNQYEAYEISNFCKKGFRSIHNSSYWQNKSYLGFGPSAHSFHDDRRRWNIANNNLYIQSIESGIEYFESEILSKRDRFNEYVMVNLRRIEGVDLNYIEKMFPEYLTLAKNILDQYTSKADIDNRDSKYSLTNKGKFISDLIIRDLFM